MRILLFWLLKCLGTSILLLSSLHSSILSCYESTSSFSVALGYYFGCWFKPLAIFPSCLGYFATGLKQVYNCCINWWCYFTTLVVTGESFYVQVCVEYHISLECGTLRVYFHQQQKEWIISRCDWPTFFMMFLPIIWWVVALKMVCDVSDNVVLV